MIEKLKFYSLIGIGVLIGIVVVSVLKHDGINWASIGRSTGVATLLFIAYFLLQQGKERVEHKR